MEARHSVLVVRSSAGERVSAGSYGNARILPIVQDKPMAEFRRVGTIADTGFVTVNRRPTTWTGT